MSETEAQNAINAAAAEAARIYFRAVEALPPWRRWLLRRLSPPYPLVDAKLPPDQITLSRPLEVPPGVGIYGVSVAAGPQWRP